MVLCELKKGFFADCSHELTLLFANKLPEEDPEDAAVDEDENRDLESVELFDEKNVLLFPNGKVFCMEGLPADLNMLDDCDLCIHKPFINPLPLPALL